MNSIEGAGHWSQSKLGELAEVKRTRIKPAERPDLPFIGMKDIEAHTMRLLQTVPSSSMKSSAVHFFPGDVLYGRLRPYLNKVYRPDFEGLCSAEFIPLTPVDGVEAKYLQYRLNSADFVAFANSQNEGDRPRVDFGQISEFQIACPPAAEQREIVDTIEAHLTRLDAAVANLEHVKANLKRYRTSALRAAVDGRLVPTEAELAQREGRDYEPASELLERILEHRRRRWEKAELAKIVAKCKKPRDDKWKEKYRELEGPDTSQLPELPEGWCWTTAETVGDILLGRQRAPQYLTGENPKPYLRVANIKDDRIDLSDIKTMDFDGVHFDKYRLLVGDILVSEGQSPELVGQSAIYRGGIDNLCFQKTLHRFRPISGGPSTEFAQVVFRANVKNGVFKRLASITTNIAHLTLEKFRTSPFPLPPLAEQERIFEAVSAIESVIDEVESMGEKARGKCRALRTAILRDAFEGKLKSNGAADANDPVPV